MPLLLVVPQKCYYCFFFLFTTESSRPVGVLFPWKKGRETDSERESRMCVFMYTHACCVTSMARARVTTALRYCIGSSGPSHLFCHVKGHWDRQTGTKRKLFRTIMIKHITKKQVSARRQSILCYFNCGHSAISKLHASVRLLCGWLNAAVNSESQSHT